MQQSKIQSKIELQASRPMGQRYLHNSSSRHGLPRSRSHGWQCQLHIRILDKWNMLFMLFFTSLCPGFRQSMPEWRRGDLCRYPCRWGSCAYFSVFNGTRSYPIGLVVGGGICLNDLDLMPATAFPAIITTQAIIPVTMGRNFKPDI